ncbi:MAG: hypothetical protein PWR10_1563 [Halanaerobiales bacterium]|nr:hypothetical protein [Halanaerobiales bacterium]
MEKLEYKKTNWVDEEVDGEGNIIKEGTPFDADKMNKLENIIEALVNRVNELTAKLAE